MALRGAGLEFEIADIDSDDELLRLYDWRVPVILVDGKAVLEGRIDAASIRKAVLSWPGPAAPPPG